MVRSGLLGLMMLVSGWVFAADTLSLAGEWRFRSDPADQGVGERWFSLRLSGAVKLPGSMLENGKGDDVTVDTKWTASIYDSSWFFDPRMARYREKGNLKLPFWLTPEKHYVGAAWYQREIVVPSGWKGRRVKLYLERPHSETTVWVDDAKVGSEYGFCAAQIFELGVLGPGRHRITLRIDNRIKDINVGQDSHSLTDQTQGNWNGVVGQLLLTAEAPVRVEDVQVFPDVAGKRARVRFLIRSDRAVGSGVVELSAKSCNTSVRLSTGVVRIPYNLKDGSDSVVAELPMGDRMALWDEFDPALYRLRVKILGGDERVVEFGMREFRVKGTRFEINGRPVYLRGTVENCVFPLTGYAPMDEASWERVFRIARSWGLNHMRFHSYCPPEAAFQAADRVGFYLQPEGPSWANHGSSLGDGKPVDQFIYTETGRMAAAYGNHPSFCMLAYGNEPRGGHQAEWLTRFVRYWKERDDRRVYTGASVGMSWPLVPDNDYMVKSGPRGLSWSALPGSMDDYGAVVGAFAVPYVTHEMGQWCAYPDFSEIPKYTGVYREKNFELFREVLQEQGMGDEARRFLFASGKLQALCYKMEIEKSLRTPGAAGFQLLCLNDYTGQGTALVGVLNALWGEKGYITAKEFSRFCGPTVPLVRMPKFVFTNKEVLTAKVEMYHFGRAPLRGAVIYWVLRDGRRVVGSGDLGARDIPIGNCTGIGKVRVPLEKVVGAVRLRLEVGVRGMGVVNDWDCWVYPGERGDGGVNHVNRGRGRDGVNRGDGDGVNPGGGDGVNRGDGDGVNHVNRGEGVYYTTELDDKAREVLEAGGKVFLNAAGKVVKGKEVVMQFTPVFWNTSWFKMRPPHTLGLLIDTASALFGDFPTRYWSDLEWWDIIKNAQVMHLEDFPAGFRPVVQPIDTWFLNRRLGLIFEARVGKGRLVVSSAELGPGVGEDRPAARQLYYSIQRYMGSDRFRPRMVVGFDLVKGLFETESRYVFSSYTKRGPDELRPGNGAGEVRPGNGSGEVKLGKRPGEGRPGKDMSFSGLGKKEGGLLPIDRKALVTRHNVVNTGFDPMGAITVGNGRFAMTVDATGLQSFPEAYDKGVPLGTESEWGWHSWVDTAGYKFSEALKEYAIHGRKVPYAVQWSAPERNKKAADWFRQNEHRLQLGKIGFELTKKDGSQAAKSDLKDIRQVLNCWTGEVTSHFVLERDTVDVNTVGHPDKDGISVKVRSPLLSTGRLKILVRLPYPTGGFADDGDNWAQAEAHVSRIVAKNEGGAVVRHDLDATSYFLNMRWSNKGRIVERERHCFLVSPGSGKEFEFSVVFSRRPDGDGAGYAATAAASASEWKDYWMKGAAVDLSGSTDPRAFELERRVVLSQYLMRAQEAGDYPPQETGLTYNSWYGKPHLEMHWWHAAHYALWGHPELLERSLDWYGRVVGGAREIAERQGYTGVRWQKMTDPQGRESPSSVGAFLIWQQPHFIYMAELCYRGGDKAVLEKYKDLVFASADFMASYAWWDSTARRYILGPGVIPAQERFKEDSTFNPCFELAYWRWALGVAQEWRKRLGMAPDSTWGRVIRGLSALPRGKVSLGVSAGGEGSAGGEEVLYFPTESAGDAYTNPRYRGDHPAVLATYGFLPATEGLDTTIMRRTFEWIWSNWNWRETWGWDFPLTAMSATRLGMPEEAIDALLMPLQKNTYLTDGHNYQDERLRCYLPGNGGLLSAIALMCAGYDGSGPEPGIPKDGKWMVRWEGLHPAP